MHCRHCDIQVRSNILSKHGCYTGKVELPPLFSLAYHQCRWNYNDEHDVATVNAKFDEFDIPMDVIWLDIEHTDGKRSIRTILPGLIYVDSFP